MFFFSFEQHAKNKRTQKDERRNINPYATVEGFTSKAFNLEIIINQLIPSIGHLNPRVKTTFITVGLKPKELLKIFLNCWSHKIKKVLVMNNHKYDNILEVCLANPYQIFTVRSLFCTNLTRNSNFTEFNRIMDKHFENLENNLMGYKMKIMMMTDYLFVMPDKGNSEKIASFEGLHGSLVDVMSKNMNFTPIYMFVEPKTEHDYVMVLENGTILGSFYYIENDLIDLCGNSFRMFDHQITNLQFLTPIFQHSLNFIVPKGYLNKSRYLNLCF